MDNQQDFIVAVKAGDLGKVKEMFAGDARLVEARSEGGTSAILLAAYHGHPEIAQYLAERCPRLDIFEAAAVGSLEQVKALVESDPALANVYAPDGFQPLGLAAFFSHLPVVEYLLFKGARVNSASHNDLRVMPLHSAVAHRHFDIARTLLEHGAQANAQQAGNFTPLHAAAQNGQIDMVKLLLDYGADADLKTSDGKTPLSYALQSSQVEIADLLRRRGAGG